MKQLVLHGGATVSSRKKLSEIRNKFSENSVVTFEKGALIQDILASLQTTSLFDEERLVIIENPPENVTLDSRLSTLDSLTLILWFDKEIDPKKFPDSQVLFFPEAKETSIFPFLDLLANKDKKAFLELKKLKADNQYLITMIFYMLRSLIVPNKNAPEFVKRKIMKQKQNFSDNEIKDLYKFILETDFKIKSGLIENDQARFILINKFVNGLV